MGCLNLKVEEQEDCNEYSPNDSEYSFENGKCLKNNQAYGKIVSWNNEMITVEVDNGNRYMKGQIVNFNIKVVK